jgi:hypothetical protein
MKVSHLRGSLLLLALVSAVPIFAAVAADVTLPVGGYVVSANDLTYRSEITLTNHRDAVQYVIMEMIKDGAVQPRATFPMQPRETKFFEHGLLPTGGNRATNIGAMRFRAIQPFHGDGEPVADPQGQIEASSFIVADRGRFAFRGSTRQEMAGVPSSEYHAREAVFVGVEHGISAYTNVGITNLHPTRTETFYVEFQYHTPVAVVVPPLTLIQVRVSQIPEGGRSVRVYPEWSLLDDTSGRETPWVAYASTVNKLTGDAFSGTRVPVGTTFEP